jgi:hypothetical protein
LEWEYEFDNAAKIIMRNSKGSKVVGKLLAIAKRLYNKN